MIGGRALSLAAGRFIRSSRREYSTGKAPVRVAVTGAAGAIGYALLPRIASGEMLGQDQPVILQLIERTEAMNALKGVEMELDDCAFPLLHGIECTDDAERGFTGADYALLVGAKPRTKGMERGDLIIENANIFSVQGTALAKHAAETCRTLVVGNPANTNALIAAHNANKTNSKFQANQFHAMTRLDHDRAMAQLAKKTGSLTKDIEQITIWGNHSATQYPDINQTTINGKKAKSMIEGDVEAWISKEFIPRVQKRGAEIIEARGASSAMSAADAAIKHVHNWALGSNGQWVSMAVISDGSYGVPTDVISSFPCICKGDGKYDIVQGIEIDANSRDLIDKSVAELQSERQTVSHLLN